MLCAAPLIIKVWILFVICTSRFTALCKYILHRKQFVKKKKSLVPIQWILKTMYLFLFYQNYTLKSDIWSFQSWFMNNFVQSRSRNYFYKVNKCNFIFSKTYTLKSDIWSFGVVLWEMMSLGANPYSDLTVDQHFVFLRDKKRLQRPPNCSQVKLVK